MNGPKRTSPASPKGNDPEALKAPTPVADEPHIKFEFSPEFHGGDFHSVGSFACVPCSKVDELGPEKAFEAVTGRSSANIVFYTMDEHFDAHGQMLEVDRVAAVSASETAALVDLDGWARQGPVLLKTPSNLFALCAYYSVELLPVRGTNGDWFWRDSDGASGGARFDGKLDAAADAVSSFALEFPVFTKVDWEAEAAAGNTRLGFEDWVLHKEEFYGFQRRSEPEPGLEAGISGPSVMELRSMLQRLAAKVGQANALQHSRPSHTIPAENWAELYQLTGEANALLGRGE